MIDRIKTAIYNYRVKRLAQLLRIRRAYNTMDYINEVTKGGIALTYNSKGEQIRELSHRKMKHTPKDWTEKYI